MILRRVIAHFRKQEWTAIFLDFLIVVTGILIAFQITTWKENREIRASERVYLERLHGDVLELANRRAPYDLQRPVGVRALELITDFTNGYVADLSEATEYILQTQPKLDKAPDAVSDSILCNYIDWCSSLTLPPSELPTATELISAGRLDRIASRQVKQALLSYLQQAKRSQEFISALLSKTTNLSAEFPELFRIRYPLGADLAIVQGESWPAYVCDYVQMRENNAFLNALNRNRSFYTEYATRALAPASEQLALLHAAIDEALGFAHETNKRIAP